MNFYTADTINQFSEKIRNYFNVPNDSYFIDITKLVKQSGVEVNEVDFDNKDVSGMLVVKGKNDPVININREDNEERKRFTIAHEFSHLLLHKSKEDHVDYRQALQNYSTNDELTKEVQANMLAAAILMPSRLVKEAWVKFKDIDDIAELFKVSKSAAAIRLESLGLL